jgi:hypothetical protein
MAEFAVAAVELVLHCALSAEPKEVWMQLMYMTVVV